MMVEGAETAAASVDDEGGAVRESPSLKALGTAMRKDGKMTQ